MTHGCIHLCNTIFFHPNQIKSCCSNAGGLLFQKNVDDLDCENIKTKYNELLTLFKKGKIPPYCKNCFELQKNYDLSEIKEVKLKKFYISNWLHCNARCIYCVHKKLKSQRNRTTDEIRKSSSYDIMPFLKKLKENDLVSKYAEVYINGGEPSLLKELPDIINFFKDEDVSHFQFYSSGILYSKEIHELLKDNKIHTELIISPDAGNRELYKKIKFVDKFNEVIENLKKYNSEISNPQNRVISKYICIQKVNDNPSDLKEYIDCMHKTGIKHLRLDVDYNYRNKLYSNIPSLLAHGKQYAQELGLNVDINGIAIHDLKME